MKVSTLTFLLVSLLYVFPNSVNGQRWQFYRYEATIGIGSAQCYGDIGGAASAENAYGLKDIQLKFTRPSITMAAGYKLDHRITIKTNFVFGFLSGNDAGSKNEFTRDYSYSSTILEPSFQIAYYILPENRGRLSTKLFNNRGFLNKITQIHLYVTGGVGAVINFPKVLDIDGNEVKSDRYTPADAKFARMGLAVPVGVGVSYALSSSLLASFEFGRRFTLTDYVDGYTSRYSSANDIYDITSLSLVYKIRTSRKGTPMLFKKGLI
jgi:hypothetical protein